MGKWALLGLIACVVSTAYATEDCLDEIARHVPHLAHAYKEFLRPVIDPYNPIPFTLLAPTELAAKNFTQMLLDRDCNVITKHELKTIVRSSLIRGHGHKYVSHKLTDSQKLLRRNSYKGVLLGLSLGPEGEVVANMYNPAHPTDAIDSADSEQKDIRVCGPKGVIHLMDDFLTPFHLVPYIRKALHTDDPDPCPSSIGDVVPVGDALLVGVEVDMQAGGSTAQTNIAAQVNTVATDEYGNELPINTEIELILDAALSETRKVHHGGADVKIEIPVEVNVIVDPEDCDGDITINAPIEVEVGVDLLVDTGKGKKKVGHGSKDMNLRCEGRAQLWKRCGPWMKRPANGKGKARKTIKRCVGRDAICVEKTKYYAQCIPKRHLGKYVRNGWNGKVLECQS